MELGKYKQALRAMTKPSRLRMVIYDDTILEDSSTPEPYPGLSGPKVMPEFTPGIEPVMPTAPGMEDPRLRQIELANGGVVDREGFAKAGPVFASEKEIESFKKEMKKKYPGLGVSEGFTSGGNRQVRIRYAKRFGSERKPAFERSRYLMPTKKNLQILREDAASFVKEAKEKGFEVISDPYELRGKQALKQTEDQQKLFNDILEKVNQGKDFKYNTLADKKVYKKLLENIYEHNYLTGTGESKGRVFLRSIPETDIDTVLNKINNLPGLRDLNRGDIEYLIRQSYPQGSQARKDAFKNYRNYQRVANEIKNKFGTQFQLEHPLSRKAIERSGAGGIKESLLRVKAVPKAFNDFKNKYDVRLNEIQKDLLNPTLRSQATEQLKSLNQIGKLMFEGYDVGELTTTGKVKKYGSDPFIKTDLVEGLKQSLSLNNQVKENIVKYKPQLTPLFESAGFKSTKLLARGEKLAPIAKQKQILNFIEKLNPTEKQTFSKFGKLAMGLDPIDAMKNLSGKEVGILKKGISKLGNVAKMGAIGAEGLLIGGPVGAGIVAAFSIPEFLSDVSEGKTPGEAFQNVASSFTLGAIPRADKRSIEEIGGPEAGIGFEIQQNIDKLIELQEDLREAESKPREDMMDPEADFAQSAYLDNTRREINDTFKLLEPYVDKQGKIIGPEYQSYLQAKNKLEQKQAYRKGIGQMEAYNYGLDDMTLPEEGAFAQDISKASKGLEQLERSDYKKQPNNINFWGGVDTNKVIPAEDLINMYAYGGRVGLKDAGDPKDSPIVPINPMMEESPQDPSRRGFLKGMLGLGALGAGIKAGIIGLGKAAKTVKAAKVAPLTEIVAPIGETMTEFPTWFPSLIKRVREEGKQIPIFKEVEVPLTEAQYNKLSKEGAKGLYDRYSGRTPEYIEELKRKGVSRYYTNKKTDEIIGYEYEVKDLPDVLVREMEGKEIDVFFPNSYGRDVQMSYKTPRVTVDMKGKKVKYDAEFQVDDVIPEMSTPYDTPDFYPEIVNNLDEVYGGASKMEQYALRTKTPRVTQGDEVVARAEAQYDYMKDIADEID